MNKNRWIIITIESLVLLTIFFLTGLLWINSPRLLSLSYSNVSLETPTVDDTSLFVSPFPTSDNPMAMVEELSTHTALAATAVALAAGTPLVTVTDSAFTQTVTSTQTSTLTSTVSPISDSSWFFIVSNNIPGHADSSIDIQDNDSCFDHRISIKIIHEIASDKPVEPAILTISEEGTFRTIEERQISLQASDAQGNDNEEITSEINIPDAKGSYLIYIDHPKFTFDSVIIEQLPNCHGNHNIITYYIPTDDYDELESHSSLGVKFNLIAWGPYPSVDPKTIYYGVAKILVNSEESGVSNIFWMSDDSENYVPLQNGEFIAFSSNDYYIGVTSGGRTVSIPFILETPYVNYLRNQ